MKYIEWKNLHLNIKRTKITPRVNRIVKIGLLDFEVGYPWVHVITCPFHVFTCHGSRDHVSRFTWSRVPFHVFTCYGTCVHVSRFTCSRVPFHVITCHGSRVHAECACSLLGWRVKRRKKVNIVVYETYTSKIICSFSCSRLNRDKLNALETHSRRVYPIAFSDAVKFVQ